MELLFGIAFMILSLGLLKGGLELSELIDDNCTKEQYKSKKFAEIAFSYLAMSVAVFFLLSLALVYIFITG